MCLDENLGPTTTPGPGFIDNPLSVYILVAVLALIGSICVFVVCLLRWLKARKWKADGFEHTPTSSEEANTHGPRDGEALQEHASTGLLAMESVKTVPSDDVRPDTPAITIHTQATLPPPPGTPPTAIVPLPQAPYTLEMQHG